VQSRGGGGHERRDAILPNRRSTPFGKLVWDEFESRHIVFELKNSEKTSSKDSLNQLRIYLSKPTIGRFGILVTRTPPGQSLLQAQRNAFEQSRILILIIDDEKLIDMMIAHVYLGSPDEVLEREKLVFEINY
jgi:hypothetical protein